MATALESVLQFVAGEIAPQEFRDRLYNDDSFETLLTNDPHLLPSNYVFDSGSAYHFVISQNYDDPGGVLNSQGALCDFLDRNGIRYSRTEKYDDLYNLILEAQPGWLAVDARFVAEKILPNAGDRSGAKLKEWLAKEFHRRFKYIDKPPEWIQSPEWPITKNGPLLFFGQIEVRGYFHDVAAAYVFHDPVTGGCETIIQVY